MHDTTIDTQSNATDNRRASKLHFDHMSLVNSMYAYRDVCRLQCPLMEISLLPCLIDFGHALAGSRRSCVHEIVTEVIEDRVRGLPFEAGNSVDLQNFAR